MTDRSGPAESPEPATAPADGPPGSEAEDRPATYREVFESREYRALFGASALSWIGDYLAKVALAALVFRDTHSVMLSAATLAISYLPWVAGGPLLSALAERYPYRRVMIISDLVRMSLIGLLVIPGLPLPVMLVMLFAAAMFTPPFESARSALLPMVLSGDRYVVGLSLQTMTGQAAQVVGYALGGVSAAINPRMALFVDALTFAVSALLVAGVVKPRAAQHPAGVPRQRLLREMAQGFGVVFGTPVLRAIALVVFSVVIFSIVPEGLAAGWAAELGGGSITQGLIMAAGPVGVMIGGIVVGRLMAPSLRQRLIRPFAVLLPASLLAALLSPPIYVVLPMVAVAGFSMSLMMPANGLFVQALPNGYRARAFGVMQGGMQVLQGAAMVAAGALSGLLGVSRTIGVWSAIGLVLMAAMAALWPNRATFDAAIARAKALNAAPADPPHPAEPPTTAPTAAAAPVSGAEPTAPATRPA